MFFFFKMGYLNLIMHSIVYKLPVDLLNENNIKNYKNSHSGNIDNRITRNNDNYNKKLQK